jgi:hypothetical protein
MYDFIFYFMYRLQINQKDTTPFVAKFFGILFVLLAVIMHIALLYAIMRFILFNYYGFDISFSVIESKSIDKLIWLSIFLIMFLLIFKYYNMDRIHFIIEKYKKKMKFSFFDIIFFLCVFTIPLIIAIFLVNHSISK